MTPDRTPQRPASPAPREEGNRRVRRVTRGVAAAAILGTAVFGGLAWAADDDSGATSSGASATSSPSLGSFFGDDDDDGHGSVDQGWQAPSATQQPPAATSGAS